MLDAEFVLHCAKELRGEWAKETSLCRSLDAECVNKFAAHLPRINRSPANVVAQRWDSNAFAKFWRNILVSSELHATVCPLIKIMHTSITCTNWRSLRCVRKIAKKRLLASSCPSFCPHGTTRLPLDGFSWNLIFE